MDQSTHRYSSVPDQRGDPAKRLDIALATIGDSLNHSDFYTLIPANLVDALLEVAKVAAAQMSSSDFCGCGKCLTPMANALSELVDTAMPI